MNKENNSVDIELSSTESKIMNDFHNHITCDDSSINTQKMKNKIEKIGEILLTSSEGFKVGMIDWTDELYEKLFHLFLENTTETCEYTAHAKFRRNVFMSNGKIYFNIEDEVEGIVVNED